MDRPGMDLDPDLGPIASEQPELVSVLRHVTLDDGPREVGAEVAVVGMDEGQDRATDGVGDPVIGELFPRVVEERPSALGIDAEDDLPDALDDRPITRLAVPEGGTRGVRVRDGLLQPAPMAVQHEGDQPDDGPERGHP